MKSLPEISIIIPSFNKVRFIESTLQSIVDQKYPNLEVIIQDGGSTDGSLEIIKRFANSYPKIICWESKKDKGQTDAINSGLKKATGEVVTYLNADDVYKKGALLTVGKFFAKYPKTLWLVGKGEMVDEKGREISSWATDYKNFLLAINHYSLLMVVNYLMQPSVFLSKLAYKKYGPFVGTKIGVMEYDFWLKIGKVQMPKVIDKYFSSFRMSGENISSTLFKETLKEDDKIVEKYTDNPVILGLHCLHNIARILIWQK